ncbi:MAG: hypothetical protein IJC17_03020 [Clostridia bacterium]|nr:hypothetical protein [Clostridia bacterium]
MSEYVVLALDIGASNGRGVLGFYDADKKLLKTREVHRFFHRHVRTDTGIYWDYVTIYNNMLEALRICRKQGVKLDCIAIDTWAQDYAYIGKGGEVLGLPRCYRDPVNTTHGDDLERLLGKTKEELYMHSGAKIGNIMTGRQLYHDRQYLPELFDGAKYWVYMPYLFVYLLSGTAGCDVTLPSIAGLLNIATGELCAEHAEKIGIADKTPPLFKNGTVMAHTGKTVLEMTGYDAVPIACIDAHDTSSAVSAIPDADEFMWISSGTSNMLGTITKEAHVNKALYDIGYHTAVQGDGRYCVMCGVAGMYYIQQCMNRWQDEGKNVSYEGMTAYALEHESDVWFRFEDVPSGVADMPSALRAACEKNGFAAPETPEDLYVAFANSLARGTAEKLLELEAVMGKTFDKLYVVGGGSKALAVNKQVAERTGKELYVGLSEASSLGNLLAQLIAIGAIRREEAADITRRSFEINRFFAK